MPLNQIISQINRHGTTNETDLLAKVAEICTAAGAKFTKRKRQSTFHTALTITVKKDGETDQTMIVLEA